MEALYPSQLTAILVELRRQMELEQVTEQYNKWAFMASIIVNGFNRVVRLKKKPKTVKPEEFLSKRAKQLLKKGIEYDNKVAEPERDWSEHINDAQSKGLKGPWGGET